jgi:tripartite-type tricarboxylate transporter receptor subunit TctC
MKGSLSRRDLLAASAGIAALALVGHGGSGALAADFSGETIEFMIPFEVGGGSDVWARFNAPLLSKHLAGHPTVQVLNVPGGGSITGTNQFAQRARPDGLTILGTSGSTQFPYLLGDPRVRYDYADWTVVMASPTGGVAYTKPEFGVTGPQDLSKLEGQRLVYGSQGATSLDLVPLLAFDLLGLDVQAVFGMQGRGEGRLAFERGEATIDYQTSSAYITNVQPLVDAGRAAPLFSWGVLGENGEIVRDPSFPDLPHFAEFYEAAKGEPPSGPGWEAWKAFFAAGFAAQKLIVLPNGTPDDVAEAYRDAVRQMKDDPEYQANKEAVIGAYEQVTDQEAETLYNLATNVPDESREWIRTWLSEKYNVQL